MDGNETLSECFRQDPDIGGIGVRISFYIQSFLLVLLIALASAEAGGPLWIFIATSLALQIAGIIQFSGHDLTLFQAVQVSNLVWLANVTIVIGLASYSHRRSIKLTQRDLLVHLGAMIEIILSVTLSLVLWIKSPEFRGDPCAGKTPFLLIFKDVGATKLAGRVVNTAVVVMFFLLYFWITTRELRRRYSIRKADMEAALATSTEVPEEVEATVDPQPRKAASEGSHEYPSLRISEPRNLIRRPSQGRIPRDGRREGQPPRGQKDRSYSFSQLGPYALGALFAESVVLLYFVVTNELLIRKSSDKASNWGFGQVLALIVIFPTLLALLRVLRRSIRGKEHANRQRNQGNPKNVLSVLSRV